MVIYLNNIFNVHIVKTHAKQHSYVFHATCYNGTQPFRLILKLHCRGGMVLQYVVMLSLSSRPAESWVQALAWTNFCVWFCMYSLCSHGIPLHSLDNNKCLLL